MTIIENHKDGMIVKEKLSKVLELVVIDFNSLLGCYFQIDHYEHEAKRMHLEKNKEEYTTESLLQVYSLAKAMVKLHQSRFDDNAQDLYEFFYQKSGFNENEYYCRQFPIDIKKFEKKCVSEKQLKDALKDKKKNTKEIVEIIQKTKDAFIESLTEKIEIPEFEKFDEK